MATQSPMKAVIPDSGLNSFADVSAPLQEKPDLASRKSTHYSSGLSILTSPQFFNEKSDSADLP
jgi:hypothetical protein